MDKNTYPKYMIFCMGFVNDALYVRFDTEYLAFYVLPDGTLCQFLGQLSSVLAQCDTGHWHEITEHEAMNLASCHLLPTDNPRARP